MKLITQAELARQLDLTRARVRQLVQKGVIGFADPERKLIDRDYAVHRYREYTEDNIARVEAQAARKQGEGYRRATQDFEARLRSRLNQAFAGALPEALRRLVPIMQETIGNPNAHPEVASHQVFLFVIDGLCQSVMEQMTGSKQLNFSDDLICDALRRAKERGGPCTEDELEYWLFCAFQEHLSK